MERTIAKRFATLVLSCALSLGCGVAYAEPMAAEDAMQPEVSTVEKKPASDVGLQAEPQAELKAESEPQLEAQAQPEAKTEAQPEAKTEAQPEAKTEAEPMAQAQPELQSETSVEAQAETATLRAQGHVQNKGWTDSVKGPNKYSNTIMIGSTGAGLRLEAVRLWLDNADGAIEGRAHVERVGWKSWETMSKTKAVGTEGQGLRVEALAFKLPQALSDAGYHLYYCAHIQDYGWLGWAQDGAVVGSAGIGKRIEAVELYLAKPGEEPSFTGGAGTACFVYKHLSGQAHVQNIGWQPEACSEFEDAIQLGTSGRGLRVEAIRISRPSEPCDGDIIYEAHVQNIGWQGERKNGELAGTEGQALRLEGFRVRLTGELDAKYDVWYRGHVQYLGWLGWTKNGEKAGTEGYSLRLEAVQIVFTAEGSGPPQGNAAKSNYDEPFFAAKYN